MVFEDYFHNHFVGDKLEKLNVAFHVPDMSIGASPARAAGASASDTTNKAAVAYWTARIGSALVRMPHDGFQRGQSVQLVFG